MSLKNEKAEQVHLLLKSMTNYHDIFDAPDGALVIINNLRDFRKSHPFHGDILYFAYVENLPLKIVAQKMGYSYGHIRDEHSVSLKKFFQYLPENYRQ